MPGPASILEDGRRLLSDGGDSGRKTAIVTGSVALGAVVTGSLVRRLRHLQLTSPSDLRPALSAETSAMEIMEGRTRFYERDGTGVPVVLLHGIHAAASSFEMKPVFDHLARHTSRPIFALDWFGFGRSDRPPVRYSPSIYLRQLRRFLSEHVHQPADVIALSMASEYTAEVACSLPYLVHRLVLISPTGVSRRMSSPLWRRLLISAADSIGAFEVFFYRLTRPEVLRSFYESQVFRGRSVPNELVDYARASTLVSGAHHAPRYFVQGRLGKGLAAASTYEQLHVPTLIVAPENDDELAQRFDALDDVVNRNPAFLHVKRLPAGLMPQWEVPNRFFEAVDTFLDEA